MQAPITPATHEHEGALVITEASPKPTPCSLAQELVALSSFARELQTQSHLIHFNYEGSNFLAVHEFLKDQYEAHQEQFDALGEFVRTLNYWMPMCACGLKDAMPDFINVGSYDGREMLSTYYQNLGHFSYLIKNIQSDAHEAGAIDVAHYLDELCSQICKTRWMVKATLSGSN